MGLIRAFSVFTLVFILALTCAGDSALANKRYASIVMDADTGLILSERYADKKLHPASLTKIMTLLMAFEEIEANRMDLNTRIRMSSHAASMVPSKLGLKPGSSIKTKDAIYALVTKSANDVAVAMAEHIGGSERNFAAMMTKRARALGMRNTTFRNASGLHTPRQISTARDMAMLAQYVINAYPEYYRYFSRTSFTYQGKTYGNHNKLLGTYKGVDGMKTGYVAASGFNLVASAVRNNRRIIGVVFGGRTGNSRNAHMVQLLDGGFAKIGAMRFAKAKVPLPPRKPNILVAMGHIQKYGLETVEHSESENIKMASMGALIGEGDYDLDKMKRIETGMIAMAAHTGRHDYIRSASIDNATQLTRIVPAAGHGSHTSTSSDPNWGIQIGAYASRAVTDKVLLNSMRVLPQNFGSVTRVIAPLKTNDGWVFRGRLGSMTQAQAQEACRYFEECMTVSPNNH